MEQVFKTKRARRWWIIIVSLVVLIIFLNVYLEQSGDGDGVNLLSESNRQTTPVSCLRFDNCLYYIRFFLFLQSPYMIF